MKLLLIDTTGIQPYIFGSNHLRENIGGSYLVAQATGELALRAVPQKNNVDNPVRGKLDERKRIEQGIAAEVLYCGGGNVAVLTRDQAVAYELVSSLSQTVLTDAPGLELQVGEATVEWDTGLLRNAMRDAADDLTRRKREAPRPAPLLGLAVTVACRATGLPATGYTEPRGDDPGYLGSPAILAKDGARSAANDALDRAVPPPRGFDYPDEFDELGRTWGEASYVAVVHADGNGIGKRIQDIPGDTDRQYANNLRRFSTNLALAAKRALTATVQDLEHASRGGRIPGPDPYAVIGDIVLCRRADGQLVLPFRPLVFAGDDVTFVADGRLGLSLALCYLAHFQERTGELLKEFGGEATASAGVAIVKSHYPFSRAYELSESLATSAKAYGRSDLDPGQTPPAAIDWYLSPSGPSGTLAEMRKREFQTKHGPLTLCPVLVEGDDLRSWTTVKKGIDAFQGRVASEEIGWLRGRNKLKALRDDLRSDSVRRFRYLYHDDGFLPKVGPDWAGDLQATGWQGDRCGYFDALELADLHIALPPREATP